MNNLSHMLCRIDDTVIDAMKNINQSGKGIVFIVDQEDRFVGVLTDGDIRRGIIKFNNIPTKISELVDRSAVWVSETSTEADILEYVKSLQKPYVTVVPRLRDGKVVDYVELKKSFNAPIASPTLNGNELLYVYEAVSSGWISSQGRFVRDFEKQFAKKYQSPHALTVMNGTVALHLALAASGIGPGDEVIIPSMTFAACINSVLYTGATPVIVDVDLHSWCISPKEIIQHLSPRTKAIMPVHVYGQVCDMDEILDIARTKKLFVIEDCAEAQGAKYRERYVGTMGDVGCFSFFGNKIMTTGEGGMCITKNEELHMRMQKMRDHGMSRDGRLYYHDMVGFNYRMTNLQAAIGVAQMERIESFQLKRQNIEELYRDELGDISSLQMQNVLPDRQKVCWLVSCLLNHPEIERADLMATLNAQGIDTRPFFYPLHLMQIYSQYSKSPCPNSEYLSKVGMNLPTYIGLSDSEIKKVARIISQVLTKQNSPEVSAL